MKTQTVKKLTSSQQKVVDYVLSRSSQSTSMNDLQRQFHATTIKNLIESGVLISEGKSRLRQDDMEMVYWTEVRVPNDTDTIKQLLRGRG